jgi:hypothetical protein
MTYYFSVFSNIMELAEFKNIVVTYTYLYLSIEFYKIKCCLQYRFKRSEVELVQEIDRP